jgi:predicted DNA-binding protein (MmcQ/YjbR family)
VTPDPKSDEPTAPEPAAAPVADAADATDPLDRVRRLCTALPEVEERLSHGEPTWFIRDKKSFVMYSDHHHGGRLAFWCAAPEGAQEQRIDEDPTAYYPPPYVGHRGWLGVYLDVEVDWDEVADVICDAYRAVAPKSLAAQVV